jgi:hypothetical protein
LDIFAKILAITVDAAQPCCTANERASVFAAFAMDTDTACWALNGGAGIADTLACKADLSALTGDACARVFLATTIDATLIGGTGRITGSDALALDAGGAAGALEIFARVVDAKAIDADLICGASEGEAIGDNALTLPAEESLGAGDGIAGIATNACLAVLTAGAGDA